jgi:hypothetical protein
MLDHSMRLTTAITFVGLALSATPALAVPIIGTSGGWQTSPTAQENFSTYWDGNSWDSGSLPDGGASYNPCSAGSLVGGSACNLYGPVVAGSTALTFAVSTPGTAADYWGNADGSADLNFVFGEATGAFYDFSMLGEITADWTINEIGWYNPSSPQTLNTIFSASQTTGATSLVYIPGDFGIYYRNTSGNGEMFFTQTSLNAFGNKQQFAAFQVGDTNFVGIEDIFSTQVTQSWSATSSDYDYNDVMLSFRRVNVPEPSSLLLMGLGLAAAAAKARRRFNV